MLAEWTSEFLSLAALYAMPQHWEEDEEGCCLLRVRVIVVDCQPELTYATFFAKIQLSSSNREVIDDEHHAILDCSAYADAREQDRDLFQSHITTVGDFLNQPQCNRLAKFLTWIRMLRMNRA